MKLIQEKKTGEGNSERGFLNIGGGVMVANLGGGGDELGDLVQAVQVRNQLQPQVDLRTAEQRSHKVTASHNQTSLRKEVSQQLSVGGFLFASCIGEL